MGGGGGGDDDKTTEEARPLRLAVGISNVGTKTCRHRRRRGYIGPYVVVLFVVVVLLDHAPAPDLALNAGSKRPISSDAAVVAAEAEAERGRYGRVGIDDRDNN